MDSTRRRQREQARRERNQQVREHHSTSSSSEKEPKQPLFGPVQRMDSQDDLRMFAKTVLGDCDHAVNESLTSAYNITVSPVTPASSSSKVLTKEDLGQEKDRDGTDRQPQAKSDAHHTGGRPSKKQHHKSSKHHSTPASWSNEDLSLSFPSQAGNTALQSNPSLQKMQRPTSKVPKTSSSLPSSTNYPAPVKKEREVKRDDGHRKNPLTLAPSPSSVAPLVSTKPKKHKKSKQHREKQPLPELKSDPTKPPPPPSFSLPPSSQPAPLNKSLSVASFSSTTLPSSSPRPPLRRTSSSSLVENVKIKPASTDELSQAHSLSRNTLTERIAFSKTNSESPSVSCIEKQKKKVKKAKRAKVEHLSQDPADVNPKLAQSKGAFSLGQATLASNDGSSNQLTTTTPTDTASRQFQAPLSYSSAFSSSSVAKHKRPAKLCIQPSFSSPQFEDISTDSCDLQHMLKEMTLPQSLTPIPTPNQKKDFRFPQVSHKGSFPLATPPAPLSQSNQHSRDTRPVPPATVKPHSHSAGKRPPPPAATLSSSSEDSSSDSSEDDDEDSGDGSELLFNNSPARPSSIPLHPTLPTSVNSDSDSSSSSSSSSEEESGEEEEQGKRPRVSVDENTVSMLEKVHQELLPHTLSTLTPLKKSPPSFPVQLSTLSFHPQITDETANLSPAKQPKRLNDVTSSSLQHESISAQTSFLASAWKDSSIEARQNQPTVSGPLFSESDSSSDESGSESDSESSDSEAEETPLLDTIPAQQNKNLPAASSTSHAHYKRQTTQPFELGVVNTTFTDDSDVREPSRRTSQQRTRPNSFRKKLAAAMADTSGLSHSNRSVQGNLSEGTATDKRRNRESRETASKIPRMDNSFVSENKIPLSDITSNSVYTQDLSGNQTELEEIDNGSLNSKRGGGGGGGGKRLEGDTLIVSIPLSKVQSEAQQKIKPQARVIPIPNVTSGTSGRKRTNSELTPEEGSPPARRERSSYTERRRESSEASSYRDYHGSRDRRGWSTEYRSRTSAHNHESGDYQHGFPDNEWSEQYSSPVHHTADDFWSRSSSTSSRRSGRREELEDSRQSKERYPDHRGRSTPENYHQRARSLKHEADQITVNGTEKVVRYMESVVCFARYGYALLHKDPNKTEVVFKLYQDTIAMIRHCLRIGAENKSLQMVCLRCHSVLLWRMYHLKQNRVAILHKELMEHFSSSSTNSTKMPQKSPYHSGSFSPLPSPASVGSTASSCSGAGPASSSSQDPSPTLPRQMAAKVTEHLTLSGHMHQSLDLWRQSEMLAEQCRELLSSTDHKIGRINLFSSISHIADWVDHYLRSISNRCQY